jgi:hypothetical protein
MTKRSQPKQRKKFPHYYKEIPKGVTHVDVYWVVEAWGVSNPVGHAVKKLLAAGQRGSKAREKDLREAIVSVQRALELEGYEARGARRRRTA